MIFTRTKRTAQKVADELAERGFKVGAVHGDLGQAAREKALKSFRTGEIDVLVATDVAARGIDIDDITHVINYQIPEDEQAYVHRIGRTGRAGKTGIAVTLVDWDELPRWTMIDKALDLGHPGSGRDLLQLAASLRGAGHPDRRDGHGSVPHSAGQGRQARRRGTPPRRPARTRTNASPHPRRRAGQHCTRRVTKAAPTADERRRNPPPTVKAPARPSVVVAAPRQGRRDAPPTDELPPADGQTRTPHPGRPGGRRGDRRRGRRRRRPDLVDQRRASHHQQARRRTGADAYTCQGRAGVAAAAVDARPARRPRRRWSSGAPW